MKDNEMWFARVNPVIDYAMQGLCSKPYPNHPKGCPNFGKKATCPPQIGKFEDLYHIKKPIYVIWNIFDFGSHVEKLRERHPQWTQRQLECCLYWQPRARKALKVRIGQFKRVYPEMTVSTIPEAMGINVTATMADIGEMLEWPPKTKTYQVAIAGVER